MIRQANYVDHRPYGRYSFCPYCSIHFVADITASPLLTTYLEASQQRQNADLIRQLILDKYIDDMREHGNNYPLDNISRGPSNPIALRNASIAKTKTGELRMFCPICSRSNTTITLKSANTAALGEQEVLEVRCDQCGTFELRRTDSITDCWRSVEFTPKESHRYF